MVQAHRLKAYSTEAPAVQKREALRFKSVSLRVRSTEAPTAQRRDCQVLRFKPVENGSPTRTDARVATAAASEARDSNSDVGGESRPVGGVFPAAGPAS